MWQASGIGGQAADMNYWYLKTFFAIFVIGDIWRSFENVELREMWQSSILHHTSPIAGSP